MQTHPTIFPGAVFFSLHSMPGLSFILFALLLVLLVFALYLLARTKELKRLARPAKKRFDRNLLDEYVSGLDPQGLDGLIRKWDRPGNAQKSSEENTPANVKGNGQGILPAILIAGLLHLTGLTAHAQGATSKNASFFTQPGIIITIILLLIPVFFITFLIAGRINRLAREYRARKARRDEADFEEYLGTLTTEDAEEALKLRRQALDYQKDPNALSGGAPAQDIKALLHNIDHITGLHLVSAKKKGAHRPPVDPGLTKLVMAYMVCAAGWLLVGTSVGEYVGIKFVSPDVDHLSWLSFGRLRPVHTNMVFWGWASTGMIGLGHYIVPRVSNCPLYSIRRGWISLILINAAVLLGSISLMAGINNSGGEYREYIWPIMSLFGLGVFIALGNFLSTIARRTTKEIYISNWYMVSAMMFVLTIAFVGYMPWWNDALGETIVQGYYMHMGVGMWFMFFTLGIVYYFLPQQLNKPIYSYSLGILAFWSQILFYTTIGTHHFIFSSIPWWLQTVAIVGSMGMVIPVTAGATNFIMTLRGSWQSVSSSYTLPFFLVGILFYFTGSLQGTAEAFRSTNQVWHFTDFTVAHSHLTMYGIISFFLWAAMYTMIPRLTGREAPQGTIGVHFWLALIGLLFYTVPLMYGSTLKGRLWIDGKPFVDGVVLMAPYWLWRAVGGSLMWFSHVVFFYNIYRMTVGSGVFARRPSTAMPSTPATPGDPQPILQPLNLSPTK